VFSKELCAIKAMKCIVFYNQCMVDFFVFFCEENPIWLRNYSCNGLLLVAKYGYVYLKGVTWKMFSGVYLSPDWLTPNCLMKERAAIKKIHKIRYVTLWCNRLRLKLRAWQKVIEIIDISMISMQKALTYLSFQELLSGVRASLYDSNICAGNFCQ
jgi:hypothetical protein